MAGADAAADGAARALPADAAAGWPKLRPPKRVPLDAALGAAAAGPELAGAPSAAPKPALGAFDQLNAPPVLAPVGAALLPTAGAAALLAPNAGAEAGAPKAGAANGAPKAGAEAAGVPKAGTEAAAGAPKAGADAAGVPKADPNAVGSPKLLPVAKLPKRDAPDAG